MRRDPWELGLVGINEKFYAGKWVQAWLPAGVETFPPLELMSPLLELAPLSLEIAPLETVQPFSAWAPLEVLVWGLCEYLVSGVCELCAIFRGL